MKSINSTKPRNTPLFALGQIVATPAVLAHLNEHRISPNTYIRRHQCGDWGSVPPEDAIENDLSVLNGLRVLSSYEIMAERVWIITEANRSATTLLFPSEY
jgi:hypothetical protein